MGVAVPNHERGVYGTGLTPVDGERYSVGGAKDASRTLLIKAAFAAAWAARSGK